MKYKHDTEPFTADELMAMQAGHLFNQAQQHADDHRVRYEPVPLKSRSFRIPPDVVKRLGGGDWRTAGATLHFLFGTGHNDDPTVIPPDAVTELGHGDLKKGHRVLNRLVRLMRGHGTRAQAVEQPDGNHGRG
jgi:hypothetical protein